MTLPGFVTAHSHAFQRALRGRGAGGDFWAWRDSMLAEADAPDARHRPHEYERTYSELRGAGYTAVGEFHYLGLDGGVRGRRGGRERPGIEIVLLLAAYERGGLERFRQRSVADYLGQVEPLRETRRPRRPRPPLGPRLLGRVAGRDRRATPQREGLVLHVHA